MSTACEVNYEPLARDGSNYSIWSCNVLNDLRTMSPILERVVVEGIDRPNVDWSISNPTEDEMNCFQLNSRVANFLFDVVSNEVRELILEDEATLFDAHLIWARIEELYGNIKSDTQDQKGAKSHEECSTSSNTCTKPHVMTTVDPQEHDGSAATSLQKPVR